MMGFETYPFVYYLFRSHRILIPEEQK